LFLVYDNRKAAQAAQASGGGSKVAALAVIKRQRRRAHKSFRPKISRPAHEGYSPYYLPIARIRGRRSTNGANNNRHIRCASDAAWLWQWIFCSEMPHGIRRDPVRDKARSLLQRGRIGGADPIVIRLDCEIIGTETLADATALFLCPSI
jgi:hypothetical protein